MENIVRHVDYDISPAHLCDESGKIKDVDIREIERLGLLTLQKKVFGKNVVIKNNVDWDEFTQKLQKVKEKCELYNWNNSLYRSTIIHRIYFKVLY